LEEAFVVGDQLDLLDSPEQRVGRYPKIARRLYGASVGFVAEPTKQSGDAICVVEDLDVLGSEFKIVVVDDGYPLFARNRLWRLLAIENVKTRLYTLLDLERPFVANQLTATERATRHIAEILGVVCSFLV